MPTPTGDPAGGWRRSLAYLPVGAIVAISLLLAGRSTPAAEAPDEEPPQVAVVRGLRTIVIDPGHGGLAMGAVRGGLSEKDVTLDIAVRLREMVFRRLGLSVQLTREADVDLDNDRRTEMANNWEADLFVSIHVNGYRVDSVRGPETYFLSAAASDAAARDAATRENEGAEGGPSDDPLEFILWDLAQTQHLRESSLLAENIQRQLSDLWQLPDRGVKQAPFRVLRGASMPAVLVEVGYLSNPQDSAMLADPSFRQRIAEALFRAIGAFRQQYAVLAGDAIEAVGPDDP